MAALQTTEEGGELSWSCCSSLGESFESLGARARLVTSLGARRWLTAVGRGLGVLAASRLATLLGIKLNGHVHPGGTVPELRAHTRTVGQWVGRSAGRRAPKGPLQIR